MYAHRVAWIQLQGVKYVEGCVVVLDSSEILLTFGVISTILLIKPDEPHFCLRTTPDKRIFYTLSQFYCAKDSPIPIVFCKPYQQSEYHTLGLYSLRLNQDIVRTNYIVSKYH